MIRDDLRHQAGEALLPLAKWADLTNPKLPSEERQRMRREFLDRYDDAARFVADSGDSLDLAGARARAYEMLNAVLARTKERDPDLVPELKRTAWTAGSQI